ncbi:MAG: hypothetical protein ACD_3C00001G0006 [uncultured bacterium (gcode 4)]|uniref:Uncharacterized protein n=1 Tax=uncultured bacterium (gcode 4) TaxID=1234023 RepID=K2GZC8_9BACT|nr:MAG: hypothetical protein ACD_3C00001G0006 [uncultured bacterium (gcode 4)]
MTLIPEIRHVPDFNELTEYWPTAEDSLHNLHGSMNMVYYGETRFAWVTPTDLMISVAMKMEYYMREWVSLSLHNDTKMAESIFFVLLRDRWLAQAEEKKKEYYWTWRMSQMITKLNVIQTLLEPEILEHRTT